MTQLSNREIAAIFFTVADMLEIKGESIHRVLSYRRAAETIQELPRDVRTVFNEGGLTDLPNIGKVLAEKIEELLTTGELSFLNKLADEIPLGVVDMLRIPGLGPKKAARFWKELNITSIEDLKQAAEAGELQKLSGMGAKSESKILEGIEALGRRSDRVRIGEAYELAHRLLDDLLAVEGALHGAVAGSLRRFKATIGDIDLLIASQESDSLMDAFVAHDLVHNVIVQGSTKSSVELLNGQQADLRVLPPDRYGTLLSYYTGSKEHNVRLRELAIKKGLSLNENAFVPLDGSDEILCAREEEVYTTLGLPWVPPELREDRGEVEAALADNLPNLITVDDMRGDLQMHTTFSDGKTSIREMALTAQARGYEYILITDHSYGLGVANGVTEEEIAIQRAEIDAVNAEFDGAFTVLHGIEVEIRADGSLDFDDEVLARFDLVQASLHTSLRQPREQITERLLNAMSYRNVDIIGHPRGQLILEREPADLDMDAIFEQALTRRIAMEINANPHRLDLDEAHARRAAELGVKLTISTDAHQPAELDNMRFGVGIARRAWVGADQVINTWPLDRLIQWIKERRS
ncbi:MAG: DNA polymerase/3'-5' exonuclease PolX [Chloroflexi bacterium]|nr:DNA polymerase/3'-5' exonuclease PolX [Chloroflexota bacterium]